MPKEGFSVITITELANEKARSMYRQKVKSGGENKSFSRYVNDLIIDRIEVDENLSFMAPFMQKAFLQGNSIMIKDNKIGRIVEVQVHGKELVCLNCKKKDCVHVGFACAIPEVYRVMKLQRSSKRQQSTLA
jgi:hypothetical protein